MDPTTPHSTLRIEPVPPEMRESAAMLLVGDQPPGGRRVAARRLLKAAPGHGIDLDWLFAAWESGSDGLPGPVRQACLLVPGSGHTGMVFLSTPRPGQADDADSAIRTDLLGVVVEAAERDPARRVRLVQALPEPAEVWAIEACRAAGFVAVGLLAYLRRPLPMPGGGGEDGLALPAGVSVEPMGTGDGWSDEQERALVMALDRSYEGTLDCPELCGLREMSDVAAGHRSTGVFDASSWWLVRLDGEPHGCCLLSRVPQEDTTELVYVGVSQQLRGVGLGRRVLEHALRALGERGGSSLTCAVDKRNEPALRMYAAMGFAPFAHRVALVHPVGGTPGG